MGLSAHHAHYGISATKFNEGQCSERMTEFTDYGLVKTGTFPVSRSMEGMFWAAESFNQDISAWKVSFATSMEKMLRCASSFNGYLSAWNVSCVTNMEGMFLNASSFNADLCAWNVSCATSMKCMFWVASSFNGDLSACNVSCVTNMQRNFVSGMPAPSTMTFSHGTFPVPRICSGCSRLLLQW